MIETMGEISEHGVPQLSERLRHAQALWRLPTPAFRRAAFESRGSLWEIARKTNDPDRALRNLLDRDRMFTSRLHGEAKRLDMHLLEVGATMPEDNLTEQVEGALGL
jgi:hypothetical protein